MTADLQGQINMPAVAVPGEIRWIQLYAVGFSRTRDKKEPDVGAEVQIFGENGQSVLPNPLPLEVKELLKQLPKDAPGIPITFQLPLNRTGKFTVKVTATDRIANKTAEMSFPLNVMEPK
jgi:hypothetical protein